MQTVFMKLLNEELKKRINFSKKFANTLSKLCEQAEQFIENTEEIEYMDGDVIDLIEHDKYSIRLTAHSNKTAELNIAKKDIELSEDNPYIYLVYADNEWSAETETDFSEKEKIELIEIINNGLVLVDENDSDNESPDKDDFVDTNKEYHSDSLANDDVPIADENNDSDYDR